jgi:hypothetical protein
LIPDAASRQLAHHHPGARAERLWCGMCLPGHGENYTLARGPPHP